MISGHRPAGHILTYDTNGREIGRDLEQCVHCQFFWTPEPGSGTRRGWCSHHHGFLCGRLCCERQQRRLLAQISALSGETDRHCVAYTDYVQYQRDLMLKAGGWMARPSGVLVQNA